ncbi:flagellar basal body rod protein FlgB [Fictibacillus phosphorivorans]|uniref:Flagellar basal body rod protein FlgB n=1 Tax=Fictibacillus phosphorivorans TaxID=1221500 RepID=A0A168VY41_9BACL|nr:flagellar basal body rod protein FlgB [Fictibacillus phosphorivorans]ANC76855.1 flagellar biosynthesis protein FlgB [Fictibacillus phosphorivorans]MQR96529.1 flagellar basal body rod protein FlgB [Fictibacillus phosphorivorans]
MSLFSGSVMKNLEMALDGSALKQKTISNNLANVDTPGYKAKETVFNQEFKKSLHAYRTDQRHFSFGTESSSSFSVREKTNTVMNHNGNNVDVDKEMAELAKNQLYYQTLVQRINGKFNSIKMVVKGGR